MTTAEAILTGLALVFCTPLWWVGIICIGAAIGMARGK